MSQEREDKITLQNNSSILQEAKRRGLKLQNGKWVQDKAAIIQKAEERGLKLVDGKWVKIGESQDLSSVKIDSTERA